MTNQTKPESTVRDRPEVDAFHRWFGKLVAEGKVIACSPSEAKFLFLAGWAAFDEHLDEIGARGPG